MNTKREEKNARAAIRGFNASRGAAYAGGDEADLADLLLALMVLANNHPEKYGSFNAELLRAQANYEAESDQ